MMSLNRSSWCFGWRQKTWFYVKSLQKSVENVETNHTSTFHRSRACSLFGPASKMLIFGDALPPPELVVIISGKAKCVFACGYGSWMQALFFICQDNTMRYNTHFFQKLLERKLSPGFGIWCMSPVFWIRFYRLLTRFSPCFLKFPTSFNQASSQIQPGFISVHPVFACSAFSANFSPSFEAWHKLMFTKFLANFLQLPQEKPTKNVHWEGLLASCYKEGQLASNLDRWKLTQKSPCTHCILALVLRLTELTMKLFAFGRYTACILAVLHRKLELAATGSAKPLAGNPSGPLKLQGQPSNNVKDLISNFVGFQVGSSAPV